MGIDWGERRIGVAVSDPLGLTANPLTTITVKKGAELDELRALAAQHEVVRVVVGVPIRDDGSEGPTTPKARAFAAALAAALAPIPVETWDESNTSIEANRMLKERGMGWKESKQHVDRLAAAVMLQSWLDTHAALPRLPGEDPLE